MKVTLAAPIIPFAIACSHNVYTPPARPMMLTSAQTMEQGKTAVRASGSSFAEVFGANLRAGSVGVRHGVGNRLEVVADASYLHVQGTTAPGTQRGVTMGRVGTKYRPFDTSNLAIVSGVGGGKSAAAGSYVSADGALIVGYENRYVIPFASVGGYASKPMSPKSVDVTGDSDTQRFDTAETTTGVVMGSGLRFPIETSAITLHYSVTAVSDDDSEDVFMSLGLGLETAF